MSVCKKNSIPTQLSNNSLYINSFHDLKHSRSCSEGGRLTSDGDSLDAHWQRNKENEQLPKMNENQKSLLVAKDNEIPSNGSSAKPKRFSDFEFLSTCRVLKPSSLQICMHMNEPDKVFGSKLCDLTEKLWDPTDSEHSSTLKIWDFSDSEAAPASSWSTLPNRSLLCRPLPLDIGRCTCVIVKEASPNGLHGGVLYALYTNEGQGRQDRKLAVAHHRRRNGKSEYSIAQNSKGILSNKDDSYIGCVTANLMGSKYHIWDQMICPKSSTSQSRSLLAVVTFMPTITTWTGNHRSMRAYIPKYQSMQLKNTNQVQHITGLPEEWEEHKNKVHQLFSRVPRYNKVLKHYELDFRDRGRAGLRIQSSVKNFQLKLEENGKQTILQLGRVGKSKYVMDYRYPLTGYQAFCISLASIDSKLCCTV